MPIKETFVYCKRYRKIFNYDSSVEQNFSTEMSVKHIDNCAEICYGITKRIHSNLDNIYVVQQDTQCGLNE